MRKLATIRKINNILPIEGADAIELAVVDGWKVVVKKNEYKVGDLATYLEIDSWVPTELAPFLSKGKEPREFNGVKGERLRTIKLRGQISQGLLLSVDVLRGKIADEDFKYLGDCEGMDVTELLNINKWEKTIPPKLAGLVKGNFPTAIPKTDQERVQNLVKNIENAQGTIFEVTEKLEGSSMTCYLINGEFGVCSRNLDLKRDENNAFWQTAIKLNIEEKMRGLKYDNFAIQGELIGPGIQGNIYNLTETDFQIFDVYDINLGEYLKPNLRIGIVSNLELKHVPILETFKLSGTVDDLLQKAEGKSFLNPNQEREGIVFKENGGGFTFKAVSNKYLMSEK